MEKIPVEELIKFKMLPFDVYNENGEKLVDAGEILTSGKLLQISQYDVLYKSMPKNFDRGGSKGSKTSYDDESMGLNTFENLEPERPKEIIFDKTVNRKSKLKAQSQVDMKSYYATTMFALKENANQDAIQMVDEIKDKILNDVQAIIPDVKYCSQLKLLGNYQDCHALNTAILATAMGYRLNYEEDKIIFKNPMNKNSCIKLYNLAKAYDTNFIMNTEKGRITLKKTNNEYDILLNEPIENFVNKVDVMQCLLQDSNFEKIKRLKPFIEKIENVGIKNQSKSLTNPNVKPREITYCDIADEKTSKGFGIEKMCKSLNISLKDAISIGDDYNDVSMFKKTHLSVAMGNANDEVKSNVKYVTLTNNEDGVAVFLEKLINNREEFLC